VPCGISDAGVTSLDAELAGAAPTLVQVGRDLEPYLTELLAFEPFEQSGDLPHGETVPEELRDPASEASRRAPAPTITYGLTG
jgi:lipoyl(octanoyl) transferase